MATSSSINSLGQNSGADFVGTALPNIFWDILSIPGKTLYDTLSSAASNTWSTSTHTIKSGAETYKWTAGSSNAEVSLKSGKLILAASLNGDSTINAILLDYGNPNLYDVVSFSYLNDNGTKSATDDYSITVKSNSEKNSTTKLPYPYHQTIGGILYDGTSTTTSVNDKKKWLLSSAKS